MKEIDWTITRKELLKKYKTYLPIALPSIILVTVAGLFSLWQLNDLYFGIPMLFVSYLLIFLWLVQDYLSCPHSYRVTIDGIYITRGKNPEIFFPWTDFYGYVDSNPIFFSIPKNNNLVGFSEDFTKIQQENFGVTFILLHHNFIEKIFPYFRSILVTTKPDNIEEVRMIIDDNLKFIPLNDIKNQAVKYTLAWGIIFILLIAVILMYVYVKIILKI